MVVKTQIGVSFYFALFLLLNMGDCKDRLGLYWSAVVLFVGLEK